MNSRSASKIAELERLIGNIEGHGRPKDETLRYLVAHEGARTQFRAGTHEIRLAGVAGTSTSCYVHALDAWVRAARRRIEKERAS